MMNSNYPYHPAQSSASSPRRKCSHPFEDFISNREHPDEQEDWNFIRNEINAESSSSFDSSALKDNYYPRPMAPRGLFSAQTTQKNPSSPPTNKNPVVPHHVPSFHPIAEDADNATAIPIDLSRGISDHLLMDPFNWSNHCHGAFLDPTPFQEQGMRIPQEQEDEIDPLLLLISTFLSEDHEPVSSVRRVSVLKRKCDEDATSDTPEQQSDTKEEEITSILEQSAHVAPWPPSKKPRLICPSPDNKFMEQPDAILLSTRKTSNETKNKKRSNKKLSASRKLPFDGASSDKKKVASSSKATVVSPKKKYSRPIMSRYHQGHKADWMHQLGRTIDFKKNNGHCMIPHSYPPNQGLARWAKRQRYQYKLYQSGKHSSMTLDRVQALENLDFCWDAHQKTWNERYEQLRQFNIAHGHSSVPSLYSDRKLATWVKCQRRQYKLSGDGQHNNLFPGRIELLEKLNFVWACTREDMQQKEGNNKEERVMKARG